MPNNKQEIVVKQPPPLNNVDLSTGIKVIAGAVLAGGVVILVFLAGLVWIVRDTFGRDGLVIFFAVVFTLFVFWMATLIVGQGERRAVKIVQATTESHMAMQRSDDQGEIARGLVPALINNATKHEGYQSQQNIATMQTLWGIFKEFGGGSADDPFTQAKALRAERRQLTAKSWDVDNDDEDDED